MWPLRDVPSSTAARLSSHDMKCIHVMVSLVALKACGHAGQGHLGDKTNGPTAVLAVCTTITSPLSAAPLESKLVLSSIPLPCQHRTVGASQQSSWRGPHERSFERKRENPISPTLFPRSGQS